MEDIIAQFLALNVSGLLQPLHLSAIENFKRYYRKFGLQSILNVDTDANFTDNMKSININYAIFWSTKARETVKSCTLKDV